MIQDEIKNILKSDKPKPTQALELMQIAKLINEEFNSNAFQNAYNGFVTKLKEDINRVKHENEKLANEISANSEIQKQSVEINNQHELLNSEIEKLAELRRKKEALTKLSEVQSEVAKSNAEKDNLIKKQIEMLTALNQVLANANASLEIQLASQSKTAEKNLNAVLLKLDTTQLENKFSEMAKSYIKLIEDYNDKVRKITEVKSDLEAIEKEHDEVVATFKEHHLENENIFGALKNREGALTYVQRISDEIKTRLKEYDTQIKTIIEKRDKLPVYQLEETRKYQV